MTLVTKMFQVKIGIRNIVIPGARMHTTVVIILTATQDCAQTADDQAHDPQIPAGARRVDRVGQRRVGRPSEIRRATRCDESRERDQCPKQKQPKRECVESRERDVGGTDLQRQHKIGEAKNDRGRIKQQHHRPMHGEQLVVLLVGEKLQSRSGEFAA